MVGYVELSYDNVGQWDATYFSVSSRMIIKVQAECPECAMGKLHEYKGRFNEVRA